MKCKQHLLPYQRRRAGRPRKAHPAPFYLAQAVLAGLRTEEWQTVRWRIGSKGPMQKQFVAIRMHMGTGEAGRSLDDFRVCTSAEGWLIGERAVAGNAEIKYYWSNLRLIRHSRSSHCMSALDGQLNNFTKTPNKNVGWVTSKGGGGMAFIAMSRS